MTTEGNHMHATDSTHQWHSMSSADGVSNDGWDTMVGEMCNRSQDICCKCGQSTRHLSVRYTDVPWAHVLCGSIIDAQHRLEIWIHHHHIWCVASQCLSDIECAAVVTPCGLLFWFLLTCYWFFGHHVVLNCTTKLNVNFAHFVVSQQLHRDK